MSSKNMLTYIFSGIEGILAFLCLMLFFAKFWKLKKGKEDLIGQKVTGFRIGLGQGIYFHGSAGGVLSFIFVLFILLISIIKLFLKRLKSLFAIVISLLSLVSAIFFFCAKTTLWFNTEVSARNFGLDNKDMYNKVKNNFKIGPGPICNGVFCLIIFLVGIAEIFL